MPQVDCFFRGMPHQRRKRRQHRCKHGTKPPMPQANFFLDMASKEARRPRLIVFSVGRSVGGGNVADATGNAEPNHQHCRWIVFFGHGIVGGQQCCRLIVFFGGTWHQSCKNGTKPQMPQIDCFFWVAGQQRHSFFGGKRHWRRQHRQCCWNMEPNHQRRRSIPFFGCGVEGGQQCHRLIVFWVDAASKE